jgi:transcriptional regulator with XRE-family HTH domain
MSNNIRDKAVLVKFGKRLRELRLQQGLTQEQLAYATDVDLSQIHRLEAAKTNATLTTLSALATALDTTVSELLAGI